MTDEEERLCCSDKEDALAEEEHTEGELQHTEGEQWHVDEGQYIEKEQQDVDGKQQHGGQHAEEGQVNFYRMLDTLFAC